MNSVKRKIITKCVILTSMTYLQCSIEIYSDLYPYGMQSQFICFVNYSHLIQKLNLNLVTKLKLLSIINITNIDINLIFS